MVKDKEGRKQPVNKPPSRIRYEERHRVRSCRLDIETDRLLTEHLDSIGCSFADFVKDHLRKEETMVKESVDVLASKRMEESKTRAPNLELYHIVLDLAHWVTLLWLNLPDLIKVPCPDCLFPPAITKQQPRTVMMQMLESGDFRCPQCGLTLKNPPQLAWILAVRIAKEKLRREGLLQSKEKGVDGGGNVVHDNAA